MLWITTISSTALLLFLAAPTVVTVQGEIVDDLSFEWNDVTLPFPVSDVMANYIPSEDETGNDAGGFVIITGGCDAIKGNERVNFGDGDLFACLTTSNKTIKFDPNANKFEVMADMPHERQRHAAVVIKGHLFLLGGRDSNDELVKPIDVYNPFTNQWTTKGEIPDDVVTSDLTAWSYKDDKIYVTGGFIADYTAVGTTYRLTPFVKTGGGDEGDVSEALASTYDEMNYQELKSSPHPRGDIHAVVLGEYAYMAGGLTHTSLWCEALTTTERYDITNDKWEEIAPLSVGRADMAVAVLNGKIISLGGETKPDDCKDVNDPAYGSFPADHVEVLLNPHEDDTAQWTFFSQFKDQRFRFAAVVVPTQNKLYTFGGQLPFDFTCDCFPTSNKVGVATEVYAAPPAPAASDSSTSGGSGGEDPDDEDSSGLDSGWIAFIVVVSIFGLMMIGFLVRWMSRKHNIEQIEAKTAEDFVPTGDGIE